MREEKAKADTRDRVRPIDCQGVRIESAPESQSDPGVFRPASHPGNDNSASVRSDSVADPAAGRSGRIQVLTRAVDILHTVANGSDGLSLGKIAQQVGLPRSTVQRIVNALLVENLLTMGPNARGYKIGAGVQQLAESARQDVPQSLRPVLEGLSEVTGETVDLATCRNDQMVFLDQVPGKQRLRTVSAVGEIFPMTITANGKAVLAMKQNDTVTEICQRERAAGITANSFLALRKELSKVCADGFSLDLDDHTPGISAVGLGFRYLTIYYAISIPAPTHRFVENQREFVSRLLESRSEICRALPDVEFN